jgi:hypothetical protein
VAHNVKVKWRSPLSVSDSVSGLQFDVVTTGTLTKTLNSNFLMESATVGANTLRVLVYTLGSFAFNGPFARSSAPITGVSNVVGSDLDGNAVAVNVTY